MISNTSELAAKFLPNEIELPLTNYEIYNADNNILFTGFDSKEEKKFLISEKKENINEESVLISEIIIKGWEKHPEGRKLELAHMIL